MAKYNPKKIESKWQKIWEKSPKLFAADEKSKKPKFFCLDMFPYPSGDGLHVGHVEGYTASDIYSRWLRMNGKNVLHPMGWDAFGLPAENFAIKTGVHPAKSTQKNIRTFTRQIKSLGLSYDWSREIDTSSPEYYKWTQWFFLFLQKNGLAYRKKAKVNWCPDCKTVLANEQVEDGACERCKNEVVQKDLEQWFFRITDFADDLIGDLDKIDWPESTKTAQKNWIGRSNGAEIKFEIKNTDYNFTVFTTRPDTIFGATFAILAPENELLDLLKGKIKNWKETKKYISKSRKKSEFERGFLLKQKTGIELKGISAINPVNKKEIPVYVADFVLGSYGTGAIMSVPAHDERDFEFAKNFHLPILPVVEKPAAQNISVCLYDDDNSKLAGALRRIGEKKEHITPTIAIHEIEKERASEVVSLLKDYKIGTQKDYKKIENGGGFTLEAKPAKIDFLRVYGGDGKHIDSGLLNGLDNKKASEKITGWLEKNRCGKRATIYKLRDWLISRQRYWGAPIPMIYCEKCGWQPVPEKDLPVLLPKVKDYRPKGTSPLGTNLDFVNTTCPKCKGKARRETDTMDTFVCSSWYFFRFADPRNLKEFASRVRVKKWLPVDLYIGGAEHVVLHLLYSRFFAKALHRHGYINFNEPFTKLRHQGIIVAEDSRKMSKSLGNVVNPDDIVRHYGADTLRLYEMFMGPLEDSKVWNTKSIVGLRRFLERVWKLRLKVKSEKLKVKVKNSKLESLFHKTIKKVTEDIENLQFNTAISALMILVNEMEKEKQMLASSYQLLTTILAPFAPHIAEELWSELGHKKSIFEEKWPKYDSKLIIEEEINIVVQVNGKVRDQIVVSAGAGEREVKEAALRSEKVKKYIPSQDKIKKIVFVPGRLINFVV